MARHEKDHQQYPSVSRLSRDERMAKQIAERKRDKTRRRKAAANEATLERALVDVAAGVLPSVAKADELGMRVVPDPYNGSYQTRVVVALRDDPLGRLYKRRQIDEAQYEAGRQWQDQYELALVAGARAIDTTKEAVDGGRIAEPLSNRHMTALKWLMSAGRALGLEGEALVRDVLGERLSLAQVAARRGLDNRQGSADMKFLGKRFRECLETLAWRFGLAVRGPRGVELEDVFAAIAERHEKAGTRRILTNRMRNSQTSA